MTDTVDITQPLEVVALEGADEPVGTVWEAEFVEIDEDGDVFVCTDAPWEIFKPTGEHWLGEPYRLRNRKPSDPLQDEALRERVVALVRQMANDHFDLPEAAATEAKALLAELESPQDADVILELFRDAFADSEIGAFGGYHKVEKRFREIAEERGLKLTQESARG